VTAGTVAGSVVDSSRGEYRVLSERLRAAGLLERRPWRATARIGLTLAAYGVGWAALFLFGDSWRALGIAAYLAFMSTQVLFVGHDAGHQQLFASRGANWRVGLLVGNVLTGLSFSWWVPKHNAHHAFPNQIGRDPDIGPGAIPTVPVAVDAEGHRDSGRLQAWSRVLVSVPLILLEVGMHLSSGKDLAQRRDRGAVAEWVLLAGHATLYLAAVFFVLAPVRAVAFIALQQGLFGLYLRMCFAPNHKGMPIIEHDTEMGFVERQVITSRNIAGRRLTTFMLGGLNYQIEHHLFPTMRRANLPRAQGSVRAFCAEIGLVYREDGLLDSYRQALESLSATSTPEMASSRWRHAEGQIAPRDRTIPL
jgi:fatty acid desaturase